jgi:cell shape-determining protein MreD
MSIFIAGIINDVIIGIPIGVSSLCYLLICSATAYIRNITLSPNFINDWLSFLFTILLINSIQVIILDLIFLIELNYMSYLVNTGFTFIFYPLFFFIFNMINKKIIVKLND